MTGGFIEKRIKKTSRIWIIIGVIGVLITLAALGLSLTYLRNFFMGPILTSGEQMASDMMDDDYIDDQFVTIKVDQFYDSEIFDTTTDSDGVQSISNRYYIVTSDMYEFIYQADSLDENQTEITGELFWLSDTWYDKFTRVIDKQEPFSQKGILPVILEVTNYRLRGYIGLPLAAICLFIFSLFIVTGTRRLMNPKLHPSMIDLAKTGPVEFIIDRIDMEMLNPHEKSGGVHFLNNWLLIETRSGFSTMRYEDIVWAYKQSVPIQNFRVNFGTIESLMVADRFEQMVYVPCKNGELDRMMARLLPHIPFAYKGYSNELANVWVQNPKTLISGFNDRKTVVSTPPVLPPSE